MSTWAWVGVGLAAFCVISTLAGLAIAAILGRIGADASRLLEAEEWARAPVSREKTEAEDKECPRSLSADHEEPHSHSRLRGSVRRTRARLHL